MVSWGNRRKKNFLWNFRLYESRDVEELGIYVLIYTKPHNESVDVWAMGVLLFEMLNGYAPFSSRNARDKIAATILSCE